MNILEDLLKGDKDDETPIQANYSAHGIRYGTERMRSSCNGCPYPGTGHPYPGTGRPSSNNSTSCSTDDRTRCERFYAPDNQSRSVVFNDWW
jgi:hypothetical protein